MINRLFLKYIFVSLLLILALFGQVATAGQKVLLNFKGADVRTLVEAVAEATGKTFVLDPSVKGKVTVMATEPLEGEELYKVFLSVLEIHGFVAIPQGKTIKIVPDTQLKTSAPLLDELAGGSLDRGDEVGMRLFELKNVDASTLMPILRPLISPKGHIGVHDSGNALLVADYGDVLHRLERLLQRVDHPTKGDMEVVSLHHANATEVVRVLNNLIQGEKKEEHKVGSRLVADERTNSVLMAGDKATRLRMRVLISHLDTPVEMSGNTQVVNLRFARADELATILASVGENYLREQKAGKAEGAARDAGIVNVQPYKGNNALVITAPQELHRTLLDVVKRLDVRRAQVQVEAIIAEITTSRAAELGVQWNVLPNVLSQGAIGGVSFADKAATAINQLTTEPQNMGPGLNLGHANGVSTLLGRTYLNLNVLLHALRTDGSTNVLSTPNLVTLDNEEAEILVGQNVPFITGNYMVNNSTSQNPFQTIKRENVGLNLKVKPQINEGDTIRLDIQQEVSTVDATLVNATDLVTRTRSIKTAVLVEDGETLVLGGLMTDDLKQNVDKVPLLGDIPLLGNLFQYQTSRMEKTNLMVFLRPVILRNRQDSSVITADKYDTIRRRQLEMPGPGGLMGLGSPAPQLPPQPSLPMPTAVLPEVKPAPVLPPARNPLDRLGWDAATD